MADPSRSRSLFHNASFCSALNAAGNASMNAATAPPCASPSKAPSLTGGLQMKEKDETETTTERTLALVSGQNDPLSAGPLSHAHRDVSVAFVILRTDVLFLDFHEFRALLFFLNLQIAFLHSAVHLEFLPLEFHRVLFDLLLEIDI